MQFLLWDCLTVRAHTLSIQNYTMNLSKAESLALLHKWLEKWNAHDLAGVMELLHQDVVFENFTGEIVQGKEALQRAWLPWFLNHGNFVFTAEDAFFDADSQQMLFQWRLQWPSPAKHYRGQPETRQGVDVLHFKEAKIVRKLTYSKTAVMIGNKRIGMVAGADQQTP